MVERDHSSIIVTYYVSYPILILKITSAILLCLSEW